MQGWVDLGGWLERWSCLSVMWMAHVTAGARTSCGFSWTWSSRQWTSRTSGTTSCAAITRCRHSLSDDSTRPRATSFSNSTQTTFRPTTPASEVSSNSSTEVHTYCIVLICTVLITEIVLNVSLLWSCMLRGIIHRLTKRTFREWHWLKCVVEYDGTKSAYTQMRTDKFSVRFVGGWGFNPHWLMTTPTGDCKVWSGVSFDPPPSERSKIQIRH